MSEFEDQDCGFCDSQTDYEGGGMIRIDGNPICSRCIKEGRFAEQGDTAE